MMNKLQTLGAAAVLALGMATQAVAAPIFTVDPRVIGNDLKEGLGIANQPFQSDFIGGTASSLVTYDGTTITGAGFVEFTGFNKVGGGSHGSGISGLGDTYQLWSTFQYTANLVSGTFGVPVSIADITSLTYEIWASTNADNFGDSSTTTFSSSSLVGGGTAATVTPGATAQKIGFGSLLPGGGIGGAVLNAQGGTGFNVTASYENTLFGSSFFTVPKPFYNVSFSQFNNTQQGVAIGKNQQGQPYIIAINSATGGLDFNRIPEPATLGLITMTLLR